MPERDLIDMRGLARWVTACDEAPARVVDMMRMAINGAGNAARTQVIRTLSRQMGVPIATVREGLTTRPAVKGRLNYEIGSVGGYLSLKSFDAQQRRAGVSARPWGTRRIFRSAFIIGRFGGHVFRRTTRARFPIVKLWGPAMPQELVRDKVPQVFNQEIQDRLPYQLARQMNRLFPEGKDN